MQPTLYTIRRSIMLYSMLAIGGFFVFFLLAPYIGVQALREDPWRIPQIILPTFIGYLAGASQYVFNPGEDIILSEANASLLRMMANGVFTLFALLAALLIVVFWFTNREGFTPGEGMSVDTLSTAFALPLSVLAATITVISNYLFSVARTTG